LSTGFQAGRKLKPRYRGLDFGVVYHGITDRRPEPSPCKFKAEALMRVVTRDLIPNPKRPLAIASRYSASCSHPEDAAFRLTDFAVHGIAAAA